MAKKNTRQLGTPISNASEEWADIDPTVWQDVKGRWTLHNTTCAAHGNVPPELSHYFIERFTKMGDVVLDPFSGRGTTPVEAAAQGRFGIGNDLNPLAVALTRGKLSNSRLEDVESRLMELKDGFEPGDWSIGAEPKESG